MILIGLQYWKFDWNAYSVFLLNSTLFVPNRGKQSGNKMIKDEKWMDGTGLKGTEIRSALGIILSSVRPPVRNAVHCARMCTFYTYKYVSIGGDAESYFRFNVIISRRWSWMSFHAGKWKVHAVFPPSKWKRRLCRVQMQQRSSVLGHIGTFV